jgi:cytochrome c oxidase subunit IV
MSKKLGIALAIIGFILIVLNAIEYIGGFFGLSLQTRTSMVIGIILVVAGMFMANKKNS